MAYLINCSGSKNEPIIYNPSSIDALSYHKELGDARLGLLRLCPLNWNYTLPAWQLYSGKRSKVYKKIEEVNWNKPCVEIKILSALFGWVNHTDLLPYYDLEMKNKIGNESVQKYWRKINLLQTLIDPNDINLLSIPYKKAINNKSSINALTPNIRFTDRGDQKGKWLNYQLNLISCNQ